MRMPVKLNRSFWPKALTDLLPSANDPRPVTDNRLGSDHFSQAVSAFKFGETFKTTHKARFPKTIEFIKSIRFGKQPVVLDIGASDGISSIQIMENVSFKKYYVTDSNMEIEYRVDNEKTYFYNNDQCILIAGKYFVVYSDFHDALFPFNKVAARCFKEQKPARKPLQKTKLINPLLRNGKPGIEVKHYNAFDPWPGEKVDLIIAANLLNYVYFEDREITKIIENLTQCLNCNGRLVVIDNREEERSTIFQFADGALSVSLDINGGTEVKAVVLQAIGQ